MNIHCDFGESVGLLWKRVKGDKNVMFSENHAVQNCKKIAVEDIGQVAPEL